MAKRGGVIVEAQKIGQRRIGCYAVSISVGPVPVIDARALPGARNSAHLDGANVIPRRFENLHQVEANRPKDITFSEFRTANDRLAPRDAFERLPQCAPLPVGHREIAQDREVGEVVARRSQSLTQPVRTHLVIGRVRQHSDECAVVEKDMLVTDRPTKHLFGNLDHPHRFADASGTREEPAGRETRISGGLFQADRSEPVHAIERLPNTIGIFDNFRHQTVGMTDYRMLPRRTHCNDPLQQSFTFGQMSFVECNAGFNHVSDGCEWIIIRARPQSVGNRPCLLVLADFQIGECKYCSLELILLVNLLEQPRGVAKIIQFVSEIAGPIEKPASFGGQQIVCLPYRINRNLDVDGLIMRSSDLLVDFVCKLEKKSDISRTNTKRKQATSGVDHRDRREVISGDQHAVLISQDLLAQRKKAFEVVALMNHCCQVLMGEADLFTADVQESVLVGERLKVSSKTRLRRIRGPRKYGGKQYATVDRFNVSRHDGQQESLGACQLTKVLPKLATKVWRSFDNIFGSRQMAPEPNAISELAENPEITVPTSVEVGIKNDFTVGDAFQKGIKVRPLEPYQIEQVGVLVTLEFSQKQLFVVIVKSPIRRRVFQNEMLICTARIELEQHAKALMVDELRLANDEKSWAEPANELDILVASRDRVTRVAGKQMSSAKAPLGKETLGVLERQRISDAQGRHISESMQRVLASNVPPALPSQIAPKVFAFAPLSLASLRKLFRATLQEETIVDSCGILFRPDEGVHDRRLKTAAVSADQFSCQPRFSVARRRANDHARGRSPLRSEKSPQVFELDIPVYEINFVGNDNRHTKYPHTQILPSIYNNAGKHHVGRIDKWVLGGGDASPY